MILHLVKPTHRPAFTPHGYQLAYDGPETRCPGCSRHNWYIGRSTAECAFCTTAIPLTRS
jgi:hypothetical protein